MIPPEPLWKLAASSGPFIRLAGINGAAAVILGAYGAHSKFLSTVYKTLPFNTINNY